MKVIQSVLIVALALVILCSFGNCDIPGTLIKRSRISARDAPSCLNTYLPVCGDCKTLLKCQNNANPTDIKCKDTYLDKPFCFNGACVTSAPEDCLDPFQCTNAGYIPDPLNCSRYHLCAGDGAVGDQVETYECPQGFVYNPETTMCKLSSSAEDCSVIDCTDDPSGYALYPADNKFFASCTPGEDPLMIKCPENFVFKPSVTNCVFHCPRVGRIAADQDNKSFYECYNNGTTFLYRLNTCVATYIFNQASEQCEPIP